MFCSNARLWFDFDMENKSHNWAISLSVIIWALHQNQLTNSLKAVVWIEDINVKIML